MYVPIGYQHARCIIIQFFSRWCLWFPYSFTQALPEISILHDHWASLKMTGTKFKHNEVNCAFQQYHNTCYGLCVTLFNVHKRATCSGLIANTYKLKYCTLVILSTYVLSSIIFSICLSSSVESWICSPYVYQYLVMCYIDLKTFVVNKLVAVLNNPIIYVLRRKYIDYWTYTPN